MGAFKNALKKILPPPVNSFMREVNRIVALEENNQEQINQLLEIVGAQERLISSISGKINEQNQVINQLQNVNSTQLELLSFYEEMLKQLLQKQIENNVLVNSYKASLEKQSNDIYLQNDKIAQLLAEKKVDRKMQEELKEKIVSIDSKIEPPVLYKNDFERKIIKHSFGKKEENDSFERDLLGLIKNLDEESCEKILRIVKRQQQIIDTEGTALNIYYDDEKAALQILKREFYDDIFQVSDNIWCYKKYLLPCNHFEPSVFYYKHGLNEITLSEDVHKKAIVDVGGFIGDSCLIFAPLTSSKVYSFEAEKNNYELLLRTLELNNITNVIAENIALGDVCGEIELSIAGSSTSSVQRKGIAYKERVTVPMRTLDDYVEEHDLEIGMIKVDIEGAEQQFLRGAEKTIKKQKPVLLISIYHNRDDFYHIKPMLEEWDLGYTFQIHKPILESVTGETLLIAKIKQ